MDQRGAVSRAPRRTGDENVHRQSNRQQIRRARVFPQEVLHARATGLKLGMARTRSLRVVATDSRPRLRETRKPPKRNGPRADAILDAAAHVLTLDGYVRLRAAKVARIAGVPE